MVLLASLLELKRALSLQISVVHVHHGAADKTQKEFQNQAMQVVKKFCEANNLNCYFNKSFFTENDLKDSDVQGSACFYLVSSDQRGKQTQNQQRKIPLSSSPARTENQVPIRPSSSTVTYSPACTENQREEHIQNHHQDKIQDQKIHRSSSAEKQDKVKRNEAAMREYRYQIFSDCIRQSKADYLVLAHTADDLLETRLIRLIRGTGEQGLPAMLIKQGKLVRPFIHINRSQIMDYARKRELKWSEDPSNQSADYSFRNWVRQRWLPQLEKKRPGSITTLSRSLNLIACKAQNKQERMEKLCQWLIKNQSLRRDVISAFSDADRKRILACYMKKQGFKNYRASHIRELLKQMDRPQKIFTFSLLGKTWRMSAQWLSLDKSNKEQG